MPSADARASMFGEMSTGLRCSSRKTSPPRWPVNATAPNRPPLARSRRPPSDASTSPASNSRPKGSPSAGVNIGHAASATIDACPPGVTATARSELVPASTTRTGSAGTSAHRFRIDGMLQRLARDEALDLIDHHFGLAFDRLGCRAADVGREDDVASGEQRAAQGQRLALEDV